MISIAPGDRLRRTMFFLPWSREDVGVLTARARTFPVPGPFAPLDCSRWVTYDYSVRVSSVVRIVPRNAVSSSARRLR